MQLFVHFALGMYCGLLVLALVDWPAAEEFVLAFLSGLWAVIPDGHWMLREVGLDAPAATWQSVHASPLVNLFWFHGIVDGMETGRDNLEAGFALISLFVVVIGYYTINEWELPP